MQYGPTLSGRIVEALIQVVESYGVSEAQLRTAASFESEVSDTRLPNAEAYRLVEAAIQLTRDPALGLRWVSSCRDDAFNPLHLMFTYAPSLRDAFEALGHCSRLLTDQPRFRLLEQGNTVIVRCLPPASAAATRRCMIEMQLGRFMKMIRAISPMAPLAVHFDYAQPSYDYTPIFGAQLHFQQPFNELVYDAAILDAASPQRDPDVHRAMRTIAERRILERTQSLPFCQRILDLLVEKGPGERVEMATVARHLGISERSLRRRLQREGRRYPDIVSDAQAALAKEMLRSSSRTIQEVAWEMGFVNASTFHHAFKRWTGSTPHSFRCSAFEEPAHADAVDLHRGVARQIGDEAPLRRDVRREHVLA